MTSEPIEPVPHPWLEPARVLRWLQVAAGSELATVAEDCRRAAAAYCESQRAELQLATGPAEVSDALQQAGVLAAARLYARRSSPAGLASYGEFGAAEVLRLDPDVARLLGTGRHARPVIG